MFKKWRRPTQNPHWYENGEPGTREQWRERCYNAEHDLAVLQQAAERLIGTAQRGDWEGPEIPDPVAAEIAYIQTVLRRFDWSNRLAVT